MLSFWFHPRALYDGMSYKDIGVTDLPGPTSKDFKISLSEEKSTSNTDFSRQKNFEEAARLFHLAVMDRTNDDRVPEALHYLAMLYEYSIVDVSTNPDQNKMTSNLLYAAELYDEASRLGQVESLYHLALMYAYGRGVRLDHSEASDMFRRAALEYRHAPSMRFLALLALHGYGQQNGEPDIEMSKYWFHQCIRWALEVSTMQDSLTTNLQSAERWIQSVCEKELSEVVQLSNNVDQIPEQLMTRINNFTRPIQPEWYQ